MAWAAALGASSCEACRSISWPGRCLFDGSLDWAPSPEETAAVVGGAPLPADAQAGVSLFTAIQEQLGLQLRDTRAPIETVIVTRAELPVPD